MGTSLQSVEQFLGQRRVALVGLSHDPQHFSHTVYKELAERGYELVPVNPAHAGELLEGRPTLAHIADASPPVDAALIMTPAAASADAVHEALAAGVRHLWLYRAAGAGSVSPEAVAAAQQAGANLVPGECPLMFLRDAAWFHRLHGTINRWMGQYPE